MSTIYISGPMTGYPDHNYPKFMRVESYLRKNFSWLRVVNPATLHGPGEHRREDCLRRDVRALCDCTHIYMLTGWHQSAGAKLELDVATALGLTVVFESEDELAKLER